MRLAPVQLPEPNDGHHLHEHPRHAAYVVSVIEPELPDESEIHNLKHQHPANLKRHQNVLKLPLRFKVLLVDINEVVFLNVKSEAEEAKSK